MRPGIQPGEKAEADERPGDKGMDMSRVTWLAGLAMAGVVALSGCGGTTTPAPPAGGGTTEAPPAATQAPTTPESKIPSSEEVLTKALQEIRTAQSVRIKVSGVQGGQEMTVDIAGNREGTNQRMQMALGNDQGSAEVITVNGEDYIKGDDKFWATQGAGAQASMLRDKYVATGDSTVSREINIGKLLDEAGANDLTLGDKLNTKVEEDTVDGTPAFKLSSRVGADDTEIWVTADDKNQILRVKGTFDETTATPGASASPGGKSPLDMRFSEWNAVPPVEAPPADQVLRP